MKLYSKIGKLFRNHYEINFDYDLSKQDEKVNSVKYSNLSMSRTAWIIANNDQKFKHLPKPFRFKP